MYQKVLVAVDRSALSQLVFEQALALARATRAHLMLLHVLSFDEAGSPQMPVHPSLSYYPIALNDAVWTTYRKEWEAFEQQGFEQLRSLAVKANKAGVKTELTQIRGSAGSSICEFARSWGADLIIVGCRGRSGLSELLLGSVSNYVMHHAPCSVLVARALSQPNPQDTAKKEYAESGPL